VAVSLVAGVLCWLLPIPLQAQIVVGAGGRVALFRGSGGGAGNTNLVRATSIAAATPLAAGAISVVCQ